MTDWLMSDTTMTKSGNFRRASLIVLGQCGVAAEIDAQADARRERQGREAERRFVLLIEQVFNARVDLQPGVNLHAGAEVHLLVRLIEVPVRQQQGITEEFVAEKGA